MIENINFFDTATHIHTLMNASCEGRNVFRIKAIAAVFSYFHFRVEEIECKDTKMGNLLPLLSHALYSHTASLLYLFCCYDFVFHFFAHSNLFVAENVVHQQTTMFVNLYFLQTRVKRKRSLPVLFISCLCCCYFVVVAQCVLSC